MINILSAGEAYHDIHHNNANKIRYGNWDISGLIIDKIWGMFS